SFSHPSSRSETLAFALRSCTPAWTAARATSLRVVRALRRRLGCRRGRRWQAALCEAAHEQVRREVAEVRRHCQRNRDDCPYNPVASLLVRQQRDEDADDQRPHYRFFARLLSHAVMLA